MTSTIIFEIFNFFFGFLTYLNLFLLFNKRFFILYFQFLVKNVVENMFKSLVFTLINSTKLYYPIKINSEYFIIYE